MLNIKLNLNSMSYVLTLVPYSLKEIPQLDALCLKTP